MTITETNTDADVLARELVERARALVPVLAERSPDTIKNRRVSDATVEDLRREGLLKVLQAKRNGGYGASIRTHLDVVSTLAEGCGSTSWVVGVTHAHSWMMSHFPQQAQDETYVKDPDAFISAVIAARGKAVKVDGGYRLSGAWPFGSGSQNSQWLFLGAKVYDEDGNFIEDGEFLLPTTDASIRDDWFVTGLVGTGSCTMDVDDLFVPEHRYLALADLASGNSPGVALHEGWQARLPAMPVLIIALAGTSLGLGRRVLKAVPEQIQNRTVAYSTKKIVEHSLTHVHLAEAAAMVDQAEFHLYRSADTLDRSAQLGIPMTDLERARLRADCAQAVKLSLNAVELLRKLLGGSGLGASNPVYTALTDLQAMSVHGGLILDPALEMYGRVLSGYDPDSLAF